MNRIDPEPGAGSVLSLLGLRTAAAALRFGSLEASVARGARFGGAVERLLPRRREVALTQLAMAFPDLEGAERRALFERSLRQQGRSLAELAHLAGPDSQREALLDRVEILGDKHLNWALERAAGRGLVVVSAHLGNWELCLAALAKRGYPLAVVHHRFARPGLLDWINTLRQRSGDVELIPLGEGGGRGVLRAIDAGRHIVALMDQNARRREGRFAPFFGAPACTRHGPVLIAMRRRVPILPVFIRRLETGVRHEVEFGAPIIVERPEGHDSARHDAAVVDGLTRVNFVIEEAIRRAPDQWIWSHRRFRTRPPAGPGGD